MSNEVLTAMRRTSQMLRGDSRNVTHGVSLRVLDDDIQIVPENLPLVLYKGQSARLPKILCGYGVDNVFAGEVMHLITAEYTFDESRFEMLRGEDVVAAYRDAVGSSSCMTGSKSKPTQFYADNEDVVGMLVLQGNEGYPIGRALVWNTLEGRVAVDRIYPNSGPQVYWYYLWAMQQNGVRRSNQALPPGFNWVDDKLGTTIDNLRVKVRWPSGKQFPYMDSFRNGLWHRGFLTLHSSDDLSHVNQRKNGPAPQDAMDGGLNAVRLCNKCDASYTLTAGNRWNYCPECMEMYVHQCSMCGAMIDSTSATAPVWVRNVADNDDPVALCHTCWGRVSDEYTVCVSCRARYRTEILNPVAGGLACDTCLEDEYRYCDTCDRYVHNEYWNSDHEMCDSCRSDRTWCGVCDSLVLDDEYNHTNDMCDDCYEQHTYCASCDSLVGNNDYDDEEEMCDNCWENHASNPDSPNYEEPEGGEV